MGSHSVRAVSMCSGVEGLGLGVDLALGGLLRTVLYVEVEAFAVSRLVASMESGLIPEAPVWSDLHTVCTEEPARYLRGVGQIDLLFGGIPCQPWSVAGKGLGKSDERDLWDATRAVVESYAPTWVFLENVSGFAVRDGLGRVADELQSLGYRVAAGLFSAEEVGAPHGRLRLFVLAHSDAARCTRSTTNQPLSWSVKGSVALAHAGPNAGGAEHGEQLQEPGAGAGEPGEPLGHAGRRARRTGRAGSWRCGTKRTGSTN